MDEKLQILNMVKDNTITTEEGAELLKALEMTETPSSDIKTSGSFLKVRVFEPDDDTSVNITLPVGLISIGLKMAGKFSPELENAGLSEEDISEILLAIEEGQMGKIVDINTGDGTRVEVVIE